MRLPRLTDWVVLSRSQDQKSIKTAFAPFAAFLRSSRHADSLWFSGQSIFEFEKPMFSTTFDQPVAQPAAQPAARPAAHPAADPAADPAAHSQLHGQLHSLRFSQRRGMFPTPFFPRR